MVFNVIYENAFIVLVLVLAIMILEEIIPRLIRAYYSRKLQRYAIKSLSVDGRWSQLKKTESNREYCGCDMRSMSYYPDRI